MPVVLAVAGGTQLVPKSTGFNSAKIALHTSGGSQGPCIATDSDAVRIQLSAAQ